MKYSKELINTTQGSIVQVNHRLLEQRLWNTVKDLRLIRSIISSYDPKNQENSINASIDKPELPLYYFLKR